jgi:hypothetical protein
MNPKIFCSLDFSLVHFFWTGKRNEQLNRFAASKMLLFFQKRSGGISRLTAIWFYTPIGEDSTYTTS